LASLMPAEMKTTVVTSDAADASAEAPSSHSFLDRLRSAGEKLRRQPRLLFLAAGFGILCWAYWPNFQELASIWMNEPNYSHGIFIIPVSLYLLYLRLWPPKSGWNGSRGVWWGWVLLVAVLAGRAIAYERGNQWTETATLIPAIACLMLTLGGWPLLRRCWPGLVFLVFMFPLPRAVNTAVALPLQRIATHGSVFTMQLTGLWVVSEGNVIILRTPDGPKPLEVARACNGLSMLMTLAATVTATVMLIKLPTWKRIVILTSAVPIALLSNICRIVATGWLYYYLEGEQAKARAHDWSGYLMMPLALLLVWVELMVLSWLADDEAEDAAADRPIAPILTARTS
jgi:exosortase